MSNVVRHKSLDFDCHSERSEESCLFKYMRPFTSFIYESFVKSVIHALILFNVFLHTFTGRP